MTRQEKKATENISDNEVIARVLAGEKDLYAVIVRRYNQRLYRVAMSIINDDAEAEDIMQVAYINAYENLGKFEFRSGFSTWLTRILINESLLRQKKRKQYSAINETMPEMNSYQTYSPGTPTPLSHMLNRELKNVLEEAILQLPDKYRTIFIMREIENMNVAETRECLGLSEVNVKVRLNRAKALLRNSLSHYYRKEELIHFHLLRCDKVTGFVMKHIEKIQLSRQAK